MNKIIKPPFLSTAFTDSKSETKKRFKNILCAKKKNCFAIFLIVSLLAIFSGMLVSCGNKEKNEAEPSTESSAVLSRALSEALLEKNKNSYMKGECVGEGHIILGSEETENEIIAYALTMYGEYGFINSNLEKVSGSGVIPAVITFSKTENGYTLKEFQYPKDGAYYTDSLKKMFPKKYHDEVFDADSYTEELKAQEQAYAAEYLNAVGRTAKIGDYADFEHPLPDTYTEVSNELLNKFTEYPYWIGTKEKIENGVRVVYERIYEPFDGNKNARDCIITFRKYEYETKEILEECIINIESGKIVSMVSKPEKKKFEKN